MSSYIPSLSLCLPLSLLFSPSVFLLPSRAAVLFFFVLCKGKWFLLLCLLLTSVKRCWNFLYLPHSRSFPFPTSCCHNSCASLFPLSSYIGILDQFSLSFFFLFFFQLASLTPETFLSTVFLFLLEFTLCIHFSSWTTTSSERLSLFFSCFPFSSASSVLTFSYSLPCLT